MNSSYIFYIKNVLIKSDEKGENYDMTASWYQPKNETNLFFFLFQKRRNLDKSTAPPLLKVHRKSRQLKRLPKADLISDSTKLSPRSTCSVPSVASGSRTSTPWGITPGSSIWRRVRGYGWRSGRIKWCKRCSVL